MKYEVPHKHKKNPLTHGFGVLTNIIGTIGAKRPLTALRHPGDPDRPVRPDHLNLGSPVYSDTQIPFFTISIGALLTLTGLLLITRPY